MLADADVVFCCTSAPHYLLTKESVSKAIFRRKNQNHLLVIDLSNPRNVEESIKELPCVNLFNIDDLTLITEQTKQQRQRSVNAACTIIDEECSVLESAVKANSVSGIVSDLLSQVEESRQKELAKALNMMGKVDERKKKIVSDLTSILLKQTFLPLIENFRRAAANDDTKLVEAATRIFEIK